MKLAYIGGGSLFVPSIVNGIAQLMRESQETFDVVISLYDIQPEKAQRMLAYVQIVGRHWNLPIYPAVARTRSEALEGADAVIVSVWLEKEHEQIERLWEALGAKLAEEGPGIAAWAAACSPWSLQVALEMKQYCPNGLFLTLMNPTDVMAGYIEKAAGIRAAGLCVEVDGLRGALAYYFKVPAEAIEISHAGVNHDGWVLDLKVNGQDGYQLLENRWQDMQTDPDYHPGNRGILPIMDLTGHLRSSGYHHWPYTIEQTPTEKERWQRWRGKRDIYEEALSEALQREQPIIDPPAIHPERSRLNYPLTGQTIGRLAQSIATRQPVIIPMQVRNRGAVTNFPDQAIVEVPARVQGNQIQAVRVGELPEWFGGTTRLLAIQRCYIMDYLVNRELSTLKQALAVLPMFGSAQQLNQYAGLVHEMFAPVKSSTLKD